MKKTTTVKKTKAEREQTQSEIEISLKVGMDLAALVEKGELTPDLFITSIARIKGSDPRTWPEVQRNELAEKLLFNANYLGMLLRGAARLIRVAAGGAPILVPRPGAKPKHIPPRAHYGMEGEFDFDPPCVA